jgi:ABC-2 type transport system ATP-binding protein
LAVAAVEVRGLRKDYGEVKAVKGVEFCVDEGETFGFLGPNGAGKTTTIGMLCTLVRPTAGQANVAGYDVVRRREDVRRSIGLVFQDPTLDNYLTAEQNLRFHAELYGMPRQLVKPRLRSVLELVGLSDKAKVEVRSFSGGMKRRLEIARGLLHAPAVLFLDEPTIGLDPQTRRSIWDYIKTLKISEGTTIFMTTHYMDEAEYCDRIAIIDRGQIVAMGTPDELKASVGKDRVQIQTDDAPRAIAALRERFGLEAAVHEGSVTFSVAEGGEFVPKLFTCFAELGIPVRSVGVSRPSLDDVFMSYTGTTIRDAEAGGPGEWMRRVAARGMRR